jgi:RNA polymerase sigma-70 factor (ECF subfamily)
MNGDGDPGGKEQGSEASKVTGSCSAEEQRVHAALGAGDYRTATALCARRYGPALGRLCMAMLGSQSEADDLVQDTLLVAHHSWATYRGEGTLGAWLFSIARRRCARHLERRARQEAHLRLVHDAERQPLTDEMMVRRQRAERARAALEAVRPSEREALLLRYVAELSYEEVGQACGVEQTAARKRVSRGLASLKRLVQVKE